MKAYKGFNEDMTCRSFQYEEGKEYEEKEASLCSCGFHACSNPIDVFKYYGPTDSVYHEVELDGDFDMYVANSVVKKDSKLCATKIKIGLAIELSDFVKKIIRHMSDKFSVSVIEESINNVMTSSEFESRCSNREVSDGIVCSTGDYSFSTVEGPGRNIAVNAGDLSAAVSRSAYSMAVAKGECSVSATNKPFSIAVANGENSVTETYGYGSLSANIGSYSVTESTENDSVSVNRGTDSVASASGYDSVAIVAGPRSKATVKKTGGIACALGSSCKAKGCVGSWLLLSEWKCKDIYEDSGRSDIRLFYVDGEKVKADTFYKLYNGELVKA